MCVGIVWIVIIVILNNCVYLFFSMGTVFSLSSPILPLLTNIPSLPICLFLFGIICFCFISSTRLQTHEGQGPVCFFSDYSLQPDVGILINFQ